jgi:hypothetical protein
VADDRMIIDDEDAVLFETGTHHLTMGGRLIR